MITMLMSVWKREREREGDRERVLSFQNVWEPPFSALQQTFAIPRKFTIMTSLGSINSSWLVERNGAGLTRISEVAVYPRPALHSPQLLTCHTLMKWIMVHDESMPFAVDWLHQYGTIGVFSDERLGWVLTIQARMEGPLANYDNDGLFLMKV